MPQVSLFDFSLLLLALTESVVYVGGCSLFPLLSLQTKSISVKESERNDEDDQNIHTQKPV